MLKQLTFAAMVATALAPVAAHAQEEDDAPRLERDGDMDLYRDRDESREEALEPDLRPERAGERDRRDMRHGDRWARQDDRGPRPRGPEGRRGPPRPPMPTAGFTIDLGPGRTIEVRCGNEAISECVAAAQPILDAMTGNTSAPAGGPGPADGAVEVPPPPSSLVAPQGGEASPPPPPTTN